MGRNAAVPGPVGVLAEGAVYAFFFVLGFATVGLVLALRRPANPIGWLYSAAGLAWAYPIPLGPWIDQLVREHRPLPLVAQVVLATGDLSWAPGIALGVTLPALLLPNGRLRSRRWRLVVASSVTGAVLTVAAGAPAPGELEGLGIGNPLGLAGPAGEVAAVLTVVGLMLHWLSLPAAAACVVLRFRSSRGVERQQRSCSGSAGSCPRAPAWPWPRPPWPRLRGRERVAVPEHVLEPDRAALSPPGRPLGRRPGR